MKTVPLLFIFTLVGFAVLPAARGRIFLNRTPGEPLDLEVLTRRPQQFTLRAQRDNGVHFP